MHSGIASRNRGTRGRSGSCKVRRRNSIKRGAAPPWMRHPKLRRANFRRLRSISCSVGRVSKTSSFPNFAPGFHFASWQSRGANPAELNERTSDGAVVLSRSKVGDKDFLVELKEQKILAQPAFNDVSEPFALIARDAAGGEVFQLWIVGAGRDPVFPKYKSGLRRTGDRIEIEPDALPFDGLPKSALWLRIPGELAEPLPVNAWAVDLADVRRKVEDTRRKWEAVANSDKDASKSAEAEFDTLAERLEKVIRIDEPQSKQERADLAPKSAPRHVRCGGYAMAVARAPKYKGYDELFRSGKALRDLDATAPASKVNDTVRSLGNAIRMIGFTNEKERALYSPSLDALGRMIAAIQPESPQSKAQREKTAADLKARLAEKPAILGDRVPPGIYDLGTKVDGADIVLMQFEVPEK